jgi:hypothetical protein
MNDKNKFLIRNHADFTARHNNQFHGKYTKIFKILTRGSLGFVEQFWEESFTKIEGTQDWILEVGGDTPDGDQVEEILNLKDVEDYRSWKLSQNDSAYDNELSDYDGHSL